LLSDVVMPGMNGPELAVELRKLQPGLQIVFMSGYTADTLTERALPPGSILIEKPFDADDLLATIRRLLGSPTESPR
jgi:two-component system cell cycle sensor histidine kinase/response regulator CckA